MQPENLVLRVAEARDAGILLAWRNDPETRAASHTSSVITWEDHIRWFDKALSDKNCQIFIAEENDIPVGTARAVFDVKSACWELSWTVAPQARGRGIAKKMVALLDGKFPGPIRAEVKKGNVASVKIAESIGMKLVEESEGILIFSKTLV